MEIKQNITCWLLHTTLVNNEGNCIDQQIYQHTSSLDMLKLLKERKETKAVWETEKYSCVKYYLHLSYIRSYGSAGLLVNDSDAEELLEAHSKHEQALIDSRK
jgi:hypothetical protein